jgi:hypothetical protein
VFLEVRPVLVDFGARQKNGKKLVSPFSDLIAYGLQFNFMTKIAEGVLPRLRMQIDRID